MAYKKEIEIKKLRRAAALLLGVIFIANLSAQEAGEKRGFSRKRPIETDTIVFTDTTKLYDITPIRTDSIEPASRADSISTFIPDPTRAVWYSAILPGLGQIYNRKYWKLPILIGGFMGLAYGISFNSRYYTDYSNAYRDSYSSDPNANSYINFLPYNYRNDKEWIEQNMEWIRSSVKRKKDFYRRNRDLCMIGMFGVYALAMIDAYVDAQLYTFDISPDVSMKISPAVLEPTLNTQTTLGLQCSITF